VVDLLASETQATYTIGDLARTVGVSIRALELAFRHDLETTPRAYMQHVRLAAAHEELVRSEPHDPMTVTSVALRWGFAHTGRFASRYRQRYGVMPSVTLRRSRI